MRRLVPAIVCCCILGLGRVPAVRVQDEIIYYDRTARKETRAAGAIQSENAGKIVLRPTAGAATRDIPSADIVDVVYEVAGRVKLDYTAARGDERKIETAAREEDRKKAIEDAVRSYQKLLRDLSGEKGRPVARHLQFKVARLLARAAEDDGTQADAAVEALEKFRKEHPDSWQITACTRLLARLLTERKDFDGARKVYAELAATPTLSRDTKQECELLVARYLIRGKKVAEAEKLLQDLLKGLSVDDPQATRARISLAECLGNSGKLDEAVKQLEDLIARTPDADLKALAYNTLGDCYRENNRPKDALWPYLFVDVVYHQDRREHARAVEQLARLFAELGDKERAEQYRERLKRGFK
jgi:tetratricopeptide (TPR) repeat protein